MIAETAELRLRQRRTPDAFRNDLRELEQLLAGRGWLKSRELQSLRPDWDERYIRRLASQSTMVVSGPGTPGYILASELTDKQLDQLDSAAEALIGQGRGMTLRGLRFQRLSTLRREQLRHAAGAVAVC